MHTLLIVLFLITYTMYEGISHTMMDWTRVLLKMMLMDDFETDFFSGKTIVNEGVLSKIEGC